MEENYIEDDRDDIEVYYLDTGGSIPHADSTCLMKGGETISTAGSLNGGRSIRRIIFIKTFYI